MDNDTFEDILENIDNLVKSAEEVRTNYMEYDSDQTFGEDELCIIRTEPSTSKTTGRRTTRSYKRKGTLSTTASKRKKTSESKCRPKK